MTPSSPAQFASPGWPQSLKGFMLACSLVFATLAPAQESGYDRIQQLVHAQELPKALQETEKQLAERPQDPQLRFMKGLIQSQQGQTEAALATFTALTRDYPELPEPHNNLAVLHAAAGRLPQARAELDLALQLNPNYATAHRNLGDVYLQLAAQAYRTSLKLRPDTADLTMRLQKLEALQPTSR